MENDFFLRYVLIGSDLYLYPDWICPQVRDQVYIETKRGRIKQKATLTTDIDPRVVYADYGWWFPEKTDNQLHAWSESNINILTNNKPPYGREVGSTNLVGTLCKVYKAAE